MALREASLAWRMRKAGIHVLDHGDLPTRRWRPDAGHPRSQNLDAVVANAMEVADAVRKAKGMGEIPLVLGGDCTVGIGTVAGHLPSDERIGLVYFDLHPDLNGPDSVEEGALDWMGVAHMLGEITALPALRDFAPRQPMLDGNQVLLFAHEPKHATPWELDAIERLSLAGIGLDRVKDSPVDAATEAVAHAERTWDRMLIHFDVDAVDFTDAPLSENTGRNSGLALSVAFAALGTLVRSRQLSALTITELNPDHGAEDGSTITRFVEGLVDCLSGTSRQRSDAEASAEPRARGPWERELRRQSSRPPF